MKLMKFYLCFTVSLTFEIYFFMIMVLLEIVFGVISVNVYIYSF